MVGTPKLHGYPAKNIQLLAAISLINHDESDTELGKELRKTEAQPGRFKHRG
jgi:hypothetical protein